MVVIVIYGRFNTITKGFTFIYTFWWKVSFFRTRDLRWTNYLTPGHGSPARHPLAAIDGDSTTYCIQYYRSHIQRFRCLSPQPHRLTGWQLAWCMFAWNERRSATRYGVTVQYPKSREHEGSTNRSPNVVPGASRKYDPGPECGLRVSSLQIICKYAVLVLRDQIDG